MGSVVSRNAFFPPQSSEPINGVDYIEQDNGDKIPVFYYTKENARFTFLYSHGNAEDLSYIIDDIVKLSNILNVNIVAYDYSGYGSSSGKDGAVLKPSERNCFMNIESVYKHMKSKWNIPAKRIILYGHSIGTGPTCYLASHPSYSCEIHGVILQSPIKSAIRVVFSTFITLPFDIFVNQNCIRRIRGKLLIIHGTRDAVVPFSHGMELWKLANGLSNLCEPLWIENAGHNDIIVCESFMSKLVEKLKVFLVEVQNAEEL